MFSQAMNDRVVGTFHAEIRASTEDILKRAGEVTRRVERVQQDQWVEELLNRVEKDGSASVGLEAVLQSLQEGKIHRLIYREDFRSEGFRCPSCGFLSVQGAGGCPYCKSEMERVEHMMDYAVQRVLDQGAHVCAVADDVRLQAVGSIGAILRY
jgi:peptide subunit release factor 1 (eRF1)